MLVIFALCACIKTCLNDLNDINFIEIACCLGITAGCMSLAQKQINFRPQ